MDSPVSTVIDPLLTRADVLRITTLGATKFKELVRAGKFPSPVQISPHRVAWRSSAVQAHIDALPIADAYQDVNQAEAARTDSKYCSRECKQKAHRLRQGEAA